MAWRAAPGRRAAADCSACFMRAASPGSGHRLCATRTPASFSTRRGTTAAASPALAAFPTRCRSSQGVASWWCRRNASCARRAGASRRQSRWSSTSPRPTPILPRQPGSDRSGDGARHRPPPHRWTASRLAPRHSTRVPNRRLSLSRVACNHCVSSTDARCRRNFRI